MLCDIDGEYSWREHPEWDEEWEKAERNLLERFMMLADKVNEAMWQIDNSFCLQCPSSWAQNDIFSAIQRLIEYNLIAHFEVEPAPTWVVLEWAGKDGESRGRHLLSVADIAEAAAEAGRKDILKAIGIGDRPPIDRKSYWYSYYGERIGKLDHNYWRWQGNPEAVEICPELADLFQLAEPELDVLYLLQVLPKGKHPFKRVRPKIRREGNTFVANMDDFFNGGSYQTWEPDRKDKTIRAFREWHQAAVTRIGLEKLKEVYRVCFDTQWSLIKDIYDSPLFVQEEAQVRWAVQNDFPHWVTEVLKISVFASSAQVKTAYRKLAKQYHPDVDPNGEAQMKEINEAYEAWQQWQATRV